MEPLLLWALETLFFNEFTPPSTLPSPFATALSEAQNNAATPESSQPSASIEASIQQAAASTGLSPALLQAVATVESSLNPEAVSSAGAVGVMQLMPGTAAELGVNPYNAEQNIMGGAEYLKSLFDSFHGNLPLAIAAYNAGPGAVDHFGGIPPYEQTQQYVQKVLAAYQALANTPSPS
ncbi:MAG: lytic transglycosylase domain-containing protein [Sulfobacillus thermotolerans]|nr:lytic transglycosylase domain-containing protein [Sulfobacillus thermotolerans]